MPVLVNDPLRITRKVANKVTGIGRQTAISFAVEGCLNIAIADQDCLALSQTKELILDRAPQAEVLVLPIDVRLEKDVTTEIATAISVFKRIDYAVNCAGKSSYQYHVNSADTL